MDVSPFEGTTRRRVARTNRTVRLNGGGAWSSSRSESQAGRSKNWCGTSRGEGWLGHWPPFIVVGWQDEGSGEMEMVAGGGRP
jgi:hypothetical protein